MTNIQSLLQDLPDAESAERFYRQFAEKYPGQVSKLHKNQGLLADILTIFSYSPLLAQTILRNPSYINWLNRHRSESGIQDKTEILESLGRFAATNSEIEPQILLARFRRRELLRIFLHDIRRLATVSEITEEISNLADSILEYALQLARQELDNRYGVPLEIDEKGRAKRADFCIVSLGKLGSRELNYSSDIDLLFVYSADGATSGKGAKGSVTNREYFVKLAEYIVKLTGQQTGEGAAYRVDLRLRPHGRAGALALPVAETIRYYRTEARAWERQVLIRSRSSAGAARLFSQFYQNVKDVVYSTDVTVADALENVRLSKEKINLEHQSNKGYNVKLGIGGIREIEFIAQALQLAYGGKDRWLRAPHTLISLARLADRKLLSAKELTGLFEAYEFLRRAEHLLQMENGLQTHTVPEEAAQRLLHAKKSGCRNTREFDDKLHKQTARVNRIFSRIFEQNKKQTLPAEDSKTNSLSVEINGAAKFIFPDESGENSADENSAANPFPFEVSADFAQMLAANHDLLELSFDAESLQRKNYREIFLSKIKRGKSFPVQISVLRQIWARLLTEIVIPDAQGKLSQADAKTLQTKLAEASVETALFITKSELEKRLAMRMHNFPLAVLGLGKLGGAGLDYHSDLDLILVYDDELNLDFTNLTHAEFYARAVGIFVNVLSGFTRDGNLYRVDLRLRPDGKNGATSIRKTAYLNYLDNRSAIWEWLAYVKLRAVGGDFGLGEYVEKETKKIIHRQARELQATETTHLAEETRRIRERLETEKTDARGKGREIDIKFGAGGLLDVYFAVRFLQLRDDLDDAAENRSTIFTLEKLFENGSLTREDYENLKFGYEFLSALDHNLRLFVGRSTRLSLADRKILEIITRRMKLVSVSELLENLTNHRLNIRASFENITRI